MRESETAAAQLTLEAPIEPSSASLIGKRIRALRRAQSLTLVQVAEQSGLSQPFLSQVETGRARPSFASVDRIARALGTTQVELFAALAGTATSRTSGDQSEQQSLGPSGPFAEGSVNVLAPRANSFTAVEFTADNRGFGEYFVHDEEEFVYVLAGLVDVDLGSRIDRRQTGESFLCSARVPHRWRSADGSGYRVLVIKEKFARSAQGGTVRSTEGSV